MKIDLDKVITDHTGKEILDPSSGIGAEIRSPLTVRAACVHALFMNYNDENLSGKKKFDRALLGTKLHDEKDPALEAEEIVLIKELVAKLYSPIVVLRVWTTLDSGIRLVRGNNESTGSGA